MVDVQFIKETFGILLVITGIFDAFKYSLQAFRISKAKSSKIQSRKFVLMAIGNDLVKIVYTVNCLTSYLNF